MNIKRVFKETKDILLVIISNLGNLGFLILFWFFGAFFLTKNSFGEVSFVLSIISIMSSFAIFGFGLGILTFGSKGRNDEIIISFNTLVFLLALLFGFIVGIIFKHWLEYTLMVLGNASFAMTLYSKMATEKYKKYTIWLLSCGSTRFLFGFIGMFMDFSPLNICVLYTLPPLLMGKKFYSYAFKGLKYLQFSIIGRNFRSVVLLGGIYILRNFTSYLDKIIVRFWLGSVVLGEYQFIFQIYLLLQFLPGTIQSYFISKEVDKSVKLSVIYLTIFLSIILTLVAILSSNALINWVFPNYVNVIPVIYLISLSVPFSTMASIYTSRLIANNLQKYILLSYFLSLFIQYLSMFILFPILNIQGLGVGLFISQVTILVFTLLISKKFIIDQKK